MDSLLHELNGMLYIARAALLSPYEACRITSIISIITAISWPSSYIWHFSMNTMHKIIQAQINFAIILTPLLVTPSRPWCGVGLLTLFRPHRWGKKLKLIQSIHRNQMSNYPCAILQNVTHSPGRGKGEKLINATLHAHRAYLPPISTLWWLIISGIAENGDDCSIIYSIFCSHLDDTLNRQRFLMETWNLGEENYLFSDLCIFQRLCVWLDAITESQTDWISNGNSALDCQITSPLLLFTGVRLCVWQRDIDFAFSLCKGQWPCSICVLVVVCMCALRHSLFLPVLWSNIIDHVCEFRISALLWAWFR